MDNSGRPFPVSIKESWSFAVKKKLTGYPLYLMFDVRNTGCWQLSTVLVWIVLLVLGVSFPVQLKFCDLCHDSYNAVFLWTVFTEQLKGTCLVLKFPGIHGF